MLLLISIASIAIIAYLLFKKMIKYSAALMPFVLFSILANVALAQNYTQSLIPGVNDGVGVSNTLASFLIPEDKWSQELFHSLYEGSIIITLVLVLLYLICLLLEGIKQRVH